MKLIVNVPDDAFAAAMALAAKEFADNYARRYDKPGWGWTFYEGGRHFFVRGVKGGISIALSTYDRPPPNSAEPTRD